MEGIPAVDIKAQMEAEFKDLLAKKESGEAINESRFNELRDGLNSLSREDEELKLDPIE